MNSVPQLCACGCGNPLVSKDTRYTERASKIRFLHGHNGCGRQRGKTYEELYGAAKAGELKQQQSTARKGKRRGTWEEKYGTDAAQEMKDKMRQNSDPGRNRGKTLEDIYGPERAAVIRSQIAQASSRRQHRKSHSPAAKAKIVAARARQQFPFNRTAPEEAVAAYLRSNNIRFRRQYRIPGNPLHAYDFYLGDYRVLLEVDGCYWHGCLQHYPTRKTEEIVHKDHMREVSAVTNGYSFLRIWEHSIEGSEFELAVRGILNGQ